MIVHSSTLVDTMIPILYITNCQTTKLLWRGSVPVDGVLGCVCGVIGAQKVHRAIEPPCDIRIRVAQSLTGEGDRVTIHNCLILRSIYNCRWF